MKRIGIVILLMLLSGCVKQIATITGLEFLHDRRSREVISEDKRIATEAAVKLNGFAGLKDKMHIKVTVYNAKVLLTGEAESQMIREKVIANIRIIRAVQLIYNEIEVRPVASLHDRDEDELLALEIKVSLIDLKGFSGIDETRVKVDVTNKNIYLMGLLNKAEGIAVAEKIQKIEKVRKIITLFEYFK